MIRKIVYIGLIGMATWQFAKTVSAYSRKLHKKQDREALQTWEGEGGNPAPSRPPVQPHGRAA